MLDRSRSWLEADLRRLIKDQVQESVGLDYKASGALATQEGVKREIAKDVSAFANSAGGVIVYGMTEADRLPVAIDPINPEPFSREWLENVIISNVQPRIDDLHINPIQLAAPNAGRAVYVVTIPQSLTAHQAPDNKYYKRFNFQSVPMEHYEVQDTMNRAKTPIIDVSIDSQVERKTNDLHRYTLFTSLLNRGAVAARNMKVILTIPAFLNAEVYDLHRGDVMEADNGGEPYKAINYVRRIFDQVLFPQDTLRLNEIGIGVIFEYDRKRFELTMLHNPVIQWVVYADDMVRRQGFRRVAELVNY